MKTPENTERIARDNPLIPLAEAMMLGASGSILQQEARGQEQLVSSEVLPADINADSRALLELAGVKFGEPVEGDPLFVRAELPPGWSKRATEHSMWSELLDEKGAVRARIFYKAAFYDRKAHMYATGEQQS